MAAQQKATVDTITESYNKLCERSQYNRNLVMLTGVAAAICFFGFRMNSPSVILGAMVISPLLYPIVAIASSTFFLDFKILMKNLISVLIGVCIAIGVTFVFCQFFSVTAKSEIIERLISSYTDYFFVAFFSGIAGTFAFYWPGIIEAIAGIAISVALMPPIVMTGIGLANFNQALIKPSIIIVATNIIGILLGSLAVMVFLKVYTKKKIL